MLLVELPPAVLIKNMKCIVIGRVVRSGISDPGYSCFVLLDHFLACTSSGETAMASSSTVSSPAAAVSCGRNPIASAFFSYCSR